jgi:hypothetical protein
VTIALAADLQNLEAAFYSKSYNATDYDYDNKFKLLLTAAVSVFSSKPAEKK